MAYGLVCVNKSQSATATARKNNILLPINVYGLTEAHPRRTAVDQAASCQRSPGVQKVQPKQPRFCIARKV